MFPARPSPRPGDPSPGRGEDELLDTVALADGAPYPQYHPRQAASGGRRDVLCGCGTTGFGTDLMFVAYYASVSICVMSATINHRSLNCDIADLRGELTKIAGTDVAHVDVMDSSFRAQSVLGSAGR